MSPINCHSRTAVEIIFGIRIFLIEFYFKVPLFLQVYDDKTKTWNILNESTISEKDVVVKDGKNLSQGNVGNKVIVSSSTNESLNKSKNSAISQSSKELFSKTSNKTQEVTSSSSTSSTSQQVFDEKTKRWREVDERTIKKTRPSVIRYVSQESDGTITTTYKKKKFNKITGKWTTVEEKVYKNQNANETIPEMLDDVTNITTTTYQTKIFDSKTNTWRVVDEKSFTDTHTTVPRDIVEEIERDQADVANITTTTEITKVRNLNFLKLKDFTTVKAFITTSYIAYHTKYNQTSYIQIYST